MMRKLLVGTAALGSIALGASTPVIPVEATWESAYVAPVFDTPSGTLELDQWSLNETGQQVFIHTASSTHANGIDVYDLAKAPDLTPYAQAHIVSSQARETFKLKDGSRRTVKVTRKDYDSLGKPDAVPPDSVSLSAIDIMTGTADAAVARDTATNNGGEILSSSYSWSHTAAAGATIILCSIESTNTYAGNTPTVTYNGAALSYVNNADWPGSTVATESMLAKASPSTGANTVQVTFGAGATNTSGICVTYTGTATTLPEASQSISISGAAYAASVTTLTNNAWVASGMMGSCGGAKTAGSNTTIVNEITGAYSGWTDSNAAMTPTGSYSQNLTNSCTWRGTIVSLAPPAAATADKNDATIRW